jgi:hypothetical protein
MEVIGKKGVSVDVNRVETLSPGQETGDDLIESQTGLEEESTVDRPTSNLDQCSAVRDEPKSSCHVLKDEERLSYLAHVALAHVAGTLCRHPM